MYNCLNEFIPRTVICKLIFNKYSKLKRLFQHFTMGHITILLVFIFVVYAIADENEVCSETKECQCGSICNDGVCTKGCQLFDWFMAAGSEAVVYGRKCTCGDIPDKRGMLIECEEGVEFTGAPEGVPEWENNPVCEEPSHPV